MAEKTVAQKAHIKPGTTIAVLNPAPRDRGIAGAAARRHVRCVNQSRARLPLCEQLRGAGSADAADGRRPRTWLGDLGLLPQGFEDAGLDMNRDSIWAVAEKLDMRPLGLVGIDDTWSAFRLRPAK